MAKSSAASRSCQAHSSRFSDLTRAVKGAGMEPNYRSLYAQMSDSKGQPPKEFDSPELRRLREMREVSR